jgi:hypothetical protein
MLLNTLHIPAGESWNGTPTIPHKGRRDSQRDG